MAETTELSEREKQALTFAGDTTKQLLTLSTAILGLTITFRTEMPNAQDFGDLLAKSWVSYGLSIVCGVWTLMALTGELEPGKPSGKRPSIRRPNVIIPSVLQILAFLAGTALILFFGVQSLSIDDVPNPTPNAVPVTATPIAALP